MTDTLGNFTDNNPPPEPPARPFDALKVHADDTLTEARNWLDGEPIKDADQAGEVAKLIDALRKAEKAVEDGRKVEATPFDNGKAEVQKRYKPVLDKLEQARKSALKLQGTWLVAEQARKDAEAEAARKAATEAARVASEAARAAVGSTNLDDLDAAEALIRDAKRAGKSADRAAKDTARATGGTKAITLRTVWKVQRAEAAIEQPYNTELARQRVRWGLDTHREEIELFIDRLAAGDVSAGVRQIPGFHVYPEKVAQ